MNATPVMPYWLDQLVEFTDPFLHALGLDARLIAVVDALDFQRLADDPAAHPFDRRFAAGAAERSWRRAQGATVADVIAVLGYDPRGTEGA